MAGEIDHTFLGDIVADRAHVVPIREIENFRPQNGSAPPMHGCRDFIGRATKAGSGRSCLQLARGAYLAESGERRLVRTGLIPQERERFVRGY